MMGCEINSTDELILRMDMQNEIENIPRKEQDIINTCI